MSEKDTRSWARGTERVGDLEVNQDLTFQHHLWWFQRIGLVVMALVVVAALLGLFGGGGCSPRRTPAVMTIIPFR